MAWTETNQEVEKAEDCEAYCAYAIESKLYAFIKLGENQDPDSFYCDLISEDVTKKEFLYLRAVPQTYGNVHYILLIDNSATMKRYKEEISAYIQSISENEQMKAFYTLATFGERFDVVKERITDINTVLYELDQIAFQEQYTDPYTAIRSVDTYLDSYLRGGEDLVSVILITDGATDLKDAGEEMALADEANQVILSATDVIYSTFCTEKWTETGEDALTSGKGLHELVTNVDNAFDTGKRLTELLDGLYCVCFDLEQTPNSDFSFEVVMGFGKDYEGNGLNINNLVFESIHNIKIQNQNGVQTELLPETSQGSKSGGGELLPIDGISKDDSPEEFIEIQDGSDSSAEMASLLNSFRGVLSKLGIEADNNAVIMILCIVCAVIVVILVLSVALAVRSKSSKNSSQKKGKATATEAGIPVKLEVYSGRCRNKTAFLQLSDCLTIGSSEDCDIIFDNPEVAAENSCIKLVDGQVYIEDLNSPQGTALNGMRFQGRNKLQSGEVISIGTVEFSVSF